MQSISANICEVNTSLGHISNHISNHPQLATPFPQPKEGSHKVSDPAEDANVAWASQWGPNAGQPQQHPSGTTRAEALTSAASFVTVLITGLGPCAGQRKVFRDASQKASADLIEVIAEPATRMERPSGTQRAGNVAEGCDRMGVTPWQRQGPHSRREAPARGGASGRSGAARQHERASPRSA